VAKAVQLRRETRGALVVAVSDGAVEDLDARHAATLATALDVTEPRSS
jgi:hypothetical protein